MTIIPEEEINRYIQFLDQDEFQAGKIVIVADKIFPQTGGRAHVSSRGFGRGNAYCYEEVKCVLK